MNWKILGLAGLLTLGVAGCKEEYKIQDPPNMEMRCEIGDLTMFITTADNQEKFCPEKTSGREPYRHIQFYNKHGQLVSDFGCISDDAVLNIHCNDNRDYMLFKGHLIEYPSSDYQK